MDPIHKLRTLHMEFLRLRGEQRNGQVENGSLEDDLLAALPWAVQELRKTLSKPAQEELELVLDIMRKKFEILRAGATGQFPKGRLNEQDEGEIQLRIGNDGKENVVIDFGKSVVWLGLPPKEAREFGQLVISHADALEKRTQQ